MTWITASEECVQVWRRKPRWSRRLGAFQGDCLFNIPKDRWPKDWPPPPPVGDADSIVGVSR